MNKILFLIIIVGFLIFYTPARASLLNGLPGPQVMPDNPLYTLKIWYEKIITFISFGDVKKAERYSQLAEKRLYEAEKMAEKGKEELTQRLLEEYKKYLNKALDQTEKIKEKAKESTKQKAKEELNKALERVSESTLKNQEVLLRVYELVPDQAKDAIEKVIQITRMGYERATEAVSGIKKEELQQRADDIKTRAQKLIKDWRKIFEE